jgi:hypothetical protein
VIEDSFKGSVAGRVELDSTFHFDAGTRYLIYGAEAGDRLVLHACSEIVALASAKADVLYLEGLRAGVRQGVLFGHVSLRSQDGQRSLPLADVMVVAASSNNARQENRVGQYGDFKMVLRPGTYSTWVEREGRQVTDTEQLAVAEGDQRKNFSVAALPGDFARDRFITATTMGPIVLGATLEEARRELPTASFRRTSDGDGVALVQIDFGPEESITVSAGEDDPTAPIDWSKIIESMETFSPRFSIDGLIRPGTAVDYAVMVWGPVDRIIKSEIEAREYVNFETQPQAFILRLDYTGEFSSGERDTKRYRPNAKILSIAISRSNQR